jgi:hypothetical protein
LVGRFVGTSPRHPRQRLHAVRFGRLTASLRALVELGDDARDKLGGEWILDRSYVATLVQQSLARAREIVFDSTVLGGPDRVDLFSRLDAVHGRLDRLLAGRAEGAAVEPGLLPADSPEEPEYSLLRAALGILDLTSRPPSPGVPHLAEVVAEAHEGALLSFRDLHEESWGRRAGRPLGGTGFPGPLRAVGRDRSRPLQALLAPLVAVGTGGAAPPHLAALAVLDEESCLLSVQWRTGTLLVDARCGEHPPANGVYCVFRGDAPGDTASLEEAFGEARLRRLELGPGWTGWRAGQDQAETHDALGGLGRSLGALLREGAPSSRHPRPLDRTPSGEWRA